MMNDEYVSLSKIIHHSSFIIKTLLFDFLFWAFPLLREALFLSLIVSGRNGFWEFRNTCSRQDVGCLKESNQMF